MERKLVERKALSILGIGTQLIPETETEPKVVPFAGSAKQEPLGYQNPEDYVSDDAPIPMSKLVDNWDEVSKPARPASASELKEFIGSEEDATAAITMNPELREILEESTGCECGYDNHDCSDGCNCGDECTCGLHRDDYDEEDDDDDTVEEINITVENDSDSAKPFILVTDWNGNQLRFYDVDLTPPDILTAVADGNEYDWAKHLIPNIIFRTGNPKTFMNENKFITGGHFINLGKDPSNSKLSMIGFYYINEDIDPILVSIVGDLFEKYIDGTPLSHYEHSKYCEELIASPEETDLMLQEFSSVEEENADDANTTEAAAPIDFDKLAGEVADEYGSEENTDAVEETAEEMVTEEPEPDKKPTAKKSTTKKSTSKSKSSSTTKKTAAVKADAAEEVKEEAEATDEAKDEMIVEPIRKPSKK